MAKPTQNNAILAKCHDCMGGYVDGKSDCGNTKCSLYSWKLYRKQAPDLKWLEKDPRAVGNKARKSRPLTPEQRDVLWERLRKPREAKHAAETIDVSDADLPEGEAS